MLKCKMQAQRRPDCSTLRRRKPAGWLSAATARRRKMRRRRDQSKRQGRHAKQATASTHAPTQDARLCEKTKNAKRSAKTAWQHEPASKRMACIRPPSQPTLPEPHWRRPRKKKPTREPSRARSKPALASEAKLSAILAHACRPKARENEWQR